MSAFHINIDVGHNPNEKKKIKCLSKQCGNHCLETALRNFITAKCYIVEILYSPGGRHHAALSMSLK